MPRASEGLNPALMVPTWRMCIHSNTSAAPSQMTANWTRNSIVESNVQLLLLGMIYGIASGARMAFYQDKDKCTYNAAIISALCPYSSEQKRRCFIKDTLCNSDVFNNDIYEPSSVSYIPTESQMIKSLTELACPILR